MGGEHLRASFQKRGVSYNTGGGNQWADNGLYPQLPDQRILPDSQIQQPSSQLARTNPMKVGIRNVMTAGDQ